jgi:hypothetical protein
MERLNCCKQLGATNIAEFNFGQPSERSTILSGAVEHLLERFGAVELTRVQKVGPCTANDVKQSRSYRRASLPLATTNHGQRAAAQLVQASTTSRNHR